MPASPSRVEQERDAASSRGREPSPTADAMVADGMRIALAGARLSIKNRVILDAIRDAMDYDERRLSAFAIEVLNQIALESEESAACILATDNPRPSAEKAAPHHRHHELLERGPHIRRLVSEEVRRLAADESAVSGLVRAARDAASEELQAEVVRKLTTTYARDPDYEKDLARRTVRLLRDLHKLDRRRRRER